MFTIFYWVYHTHRQTHRQTNERTKLSGATHLAVKQNFQALTIFVRLHLLLLLIFLCVESSGGGGGFLFFPSTGNQLHLDDDKIPWRRVRAHCSCAHTQTHKHVDRIPYSSFTLVYLFFPAMITILLLRP